MVASFGGREDAVSDRLERTCAACGKTTGVDNIRGDYCEESSDFACALWQLGEAKRERDEALATVEWFREGTEQATLVGIEMREEIERLRAGLGAKVEGIFDRQSDALTVRALRERDEARDCGQDGVCAITPGCQRHWEERNRELVRERDEARAERDAAIGQLARLRSWATGERPGEGNL